MEAILGFFGTFFILGSIWFWLVAVGVFAVLVALSDNEQNFWAAAVTAVFFFSIVHFNQLTVDWSMIPWYLLGYLVFGVAMAAIKWISYLKMRMERYVELKVEFAEKMNIPEVDKNTNMKHLLDETKYDNFIKYLRDRDFLNHRDSKYIIPRWKDKVGKLVSWALWWPAVIFWTILNDPIRRFFMAIFTSLRGWFENMAVKIFANAGVSVGDDKDTDRY